MKSPTKLFGKVTYSLYISNILIIRLIALFSIFFLLELLTELLEVKD